MDTIITIPEIEAIEDTEESKVLLIESIVSQEWSQFDKVNNEGGRADCQDDWKTFRIMRSAQFLNWPEDLLTSYLDDLKEAESEGRNLIAEKYGRMMESTAPDEYRNICHLFPERSSERLSLQEKIIAAEMDMDDDFVSRYPLYARGGRPSRTSSDGEYITSKETYMRGEMSTWSDRTFDLYCKWFLTLSEQGLNLPEMTSENIAELYGYDSLSDLEERLKKREKRQ